VFSSVFTFLALTFKAFQEHELPNAQHALAFSQRSLKFLEDYIGTPYTLPKLDLIALPELRFGGMENWGLITFRRDVLLHDEARTPVRTRQTISTLISHELVHMWFGNFVTPEWWEFLWLSEGFAEYFEMYVTSYVSFENEESNDLLSVGI
jgi:aminopeptidase N